MVHQVELFISKGYIGQVGAHMGIAIKCSDGWYCFEYAAGGASGSLSSGGSLGSVFGSSSTSNKVTVNRYDPPGETKYIGDTKKGLNEIIDFARMKSGFHNSKYDVTENNCRQFARVMAQFMGVESGFDSQSKWYTCTKK